VVRLPLIFGALALGPAAFAGTADRATAVMIAIDNAASLLIRMCKCLPEERLSNCHALRSHAHKSSYIADLK
jgi:hypothetical protein